MLIKTKISGSGLTPHKTPDFAVLCLSQCDTLLGSDFRKQSGPERQRQRDFYLNKPHVHTAKQLTWISPLRLLSVSGGRGAVLFWATIASQRNEISLYSTDRKTACLASWLINNANCYDGYVSTKVNIHSWSNWPAGSCNGSWLLQKVFVFLTSKWVMPDGIRPPDSTALHTV